MCFLSGNALKIIAALSMLIDHIGLMLLPQFEILRIIGRISFPIFAFMIAEGCKYTRNKLRYFLGIFVLGVACQLVYFILFKSLYMSVLISFSVAIPVVYALQYMKKSIKGNSSAIKRILSVAIFLASVTAAYVFNVIFNVDYGFFGCMLPVFASVFSDESDLSGVLKKIDLNLIRVVMTGIGVLLFATYYGGIRYFSLFSLLFLLLYSGKRGKWNLKYFFYTFYPLHLAVISGIDFLI